MKQKLSHKKYLFLALPFTLATITQPLLGAVDTAVVGQLNNPVFIGAVSIGAIIFNTLYWMFGFLRVSTSGYSAQALGEKSQIKIAHSLLRPLVIALIVGLFFIILQEPILQAALKIQKPDPLVASLISKFFKILIWGAPFVLTNYVFLGWLMGQGFIRASVFMQISTNLINIILDLIFVFGFNLDVAGVATATLIAQIYSTLLGFYFVKRKIIIPTGIWPTLFDKKALKSIMAVNSDLMVRTACLLIMTNIFLAASSKQSIEILAANAILLQIHYLIAYLYDGLANASSVFVGLALGAKDRTFYKTALKRTWEWTFIVCFVVTLGYFMFQKPLIAIFSSEINIVNIALQYSNYLVLFSIITCIGLVFYGVFTGITKTAPIRNSFILSLLLFIITYYFLFPEFKNHGLWWAFLIFGLGRSLFLIIYLPKTNKEIFNKHFRN